MQHVLKANPPVSPRPISSRTKPTKNWLPFPITGSNALPGAVCQISYNEESMDKR